MCWARCGHVVTRFLETRNPAPGRRLGDSCHRVCACVRSRGKPSGTRGRCRVVEVTGSRCEGRCFEGVCHGGGYVLTLAHRASETIPGRLCRVRDLLDAPGAPVCDDSLGEVSLGEIAVIREEPSGARL